MKKMMMIIILAIAMQGFSQSHYLETHQALKYVASQEADGYKEVLIIIHENEQFQQEEPEPEPEETEEEWWEKQPLYEDDLDQ